MPTTFFTLILIPTLYVMFEERFPGGSTSPKTSRPHRSRIGRRSE